MCFNLKRFLLVNVVSLLRNCSTFRWFPPIELISICCFSMESPNYTPSSNRKPMKLGITVWCSCFFVFYCTDLCVAINYKKVIVKVKQQRRGCWYFCSTQEKQITCSFNPNWKPTERPVYHWPLFYCFKNLQT